MPKITPLGRLREKDHKFKASLGHIPSLCLKRNNKNLKYIK
jgi:hypothetical protein